MAHTTDIGAAFVQRLYYHSDNPPLLALTGSQEIEPPYRSGRCLVVRLPFSTRAVAVGLWLRQRSEKDALLNAMSGRVVQDNDVDMGDLL